MATIASDNSTAAPAVLALGGWWLKDPTDPTLNLEVDGHTVEFQTDEPQGVFLPLGAEHPVVVSEAITGAAGTLDVLCLTQAEYDSLVTLRGTQRVLLLQSPLGDSWYVRLRGPFQVVGEHADESHRARRVSVGWIEQERP